MNTIIDQQINTNYKGSTSTFVKVSEIIKERFGPEIAAMYDPRKNCMTAAKWRSLGYHIKKGERAIKSVTLITNDDNGKKWRKVVNLFLFNQVQKI